MAPTTRSRGVAVDGVPIYTIDLSRPPALRYIDVVSDFRHKIPRLTELFGDVVTMASLPLKPTTRLAKLLMTRLHSKEQTEELRGISEASGVDMYLLVCMNVLLDLFMGCTSGGARVGMKGAGDSKGTRMLHFRTLDWAMEPLREVVVQLNFVNETDGPVIARSITYVGFVGVLTAVRPGLSMSLNFRPYHNNNHSRVSNFKFNYHRLLVLLGWRTSIAATMRDLLLQSSSGNDDKHVDTLTSIQQRLPSVPSTAAYMTFNDGDRAMVMEKDRVTAHTSTSSSFIVVTNHDASSDSDPAASANDGDSAKLAPTGMVELIEDSHNRKECIESKWKKAAAAFRRRSKNSRRDKEDTAVSVTASELIKWVEACPTTNECTHFATIMDPVAGDFVYLRRYLEPVTVTE
ncbi:hypothetical protein Daus18300_010611 [Diaporthe australafricana]|uniref:ceramidase n=1 Tax=Diaporthe australafricana TaxID=127596 RepID=A0ABR3W9L0_9PEZI